MDIRLERTYCPTATHGALTYSGCTIGYTLELPWRDNARNVSCIPEACYPLGKRYSQRFGHHLHVKHVPDRSLILFHPANDAQRELRGCIAPVTRFLREGYGIESRQATRAFKQFVCDAMDAGEVVFLHVSSINSESYGN